jgi:two-component system, OmpR family, sensor histidine kinase KdpD
MRVQGRSDGRKKSVKSRGAVAARRFPAETGAVAIRFSRWWPVLRVVLVAVLPPGVATAVATVSFRTSTTMAALGFVLAVTAAALLGGSAAGLIASVVSFLALNFFFTVPVGTFGVGKTEDLVALMVFLLVSAVVGTLVSRAQAQRHRAERREREARLLQHLGTRLLSGASAGSVFESFGRALVDLTGLARYEVAAAAEGRLLAEVGERRPEEAETEEFPLVVGGTAVGAIRTYRRTDGPPLGEEERHLIRTFAAQMVLAMESTRLATVAQAAQDDAERSRLQAALLQSVTHDLRTPLSSIIASVTSLLDDDAALGREDRHTLLETIRQEAERLDRLVGNLLDLSRLRAGALTPSKRPTALDEVVEGVLARLEPALRGHRLSVVLREDLPDVPIDVVQIDQALTNILENAGKYSPAGSEISVSVARWENSVQVRIADQGVGIDPEIRRRVLEPFFQGNGAPSGSGLGLAIAHAVVEAHGGTMRIEGAPGGGTAVVFRLPLETKG